MDFKKEFPNLNEKYAITLWNSMEYTFDNSIGREDDTAFTIEKIREYCLDKQRVKKTITNCPNKELTEEYLLNELGLK